MNIIITVQHPAHVHFFKYAVRELESNGHSIRVFVRQKDITTQLLDELEIDYEVLANHPNGLIELAVEQFKYEAKLLARARDFEPDRMMAIGEPGVAHISKLVGADSIVFTDTEHAVTGNTLALPFADRVCTPTCYQKEHRANQIRYRSYHELAYLHPDRFNPDPSVFDGIEYEQSDSLVVLRLNAWQSSHDVGDSGMDSPMEVIRQLEKAGAEVILTSEPDLSGDFSQYQVDIPLRKMHDLLYYSDLLIGESATMAAESAVLGTPAVFISTSRRGYTDELGDRYGLVSTFSGADRQEAGLEKSISILEKESPEKWSKRRQKILADKFDTTEFILQQVQQ